MAPNKSQSHLSPGTDKIFHASMRAARVPMTGVQSPSIKKNPDIARAAEIIMTFRGGSAQSRKPARRISTDPTTRRSNSSPVPGQPLANVEYKRLNTNPYKPY